MSIEIKNFDIFFIVEVVGMLKFKWNRLMLLF